MNKKILILPIILTLNILISNISISFVYAFSWPWQKKEVKDIVDPQLYEALEKRRLLEEYFKQEGISWEQKLVELTPEQRKRLVDQVNLILSLDLKPRPKFEEKDGVYIFTTGINGNAAGKIPFGIYKIEPEEIKGVKIITSSQININNQSKKRLYLGLKKGRGGIKYFKKAKKIPQEEKVLSIAELAPLTDEDLVVQLFNDKNSNGIWEKNEDAVSWAGVTVKLKKISREKQVHLNKGINKIKFEEMPKNFHSAAQLLLELTKAGGEPKWVGGQRKMLVLLGLEEYGRDFKLEKEKEYWVSLGLDANLTIVY